MLVRESKKKLHKICNKIVFKKTKHSFRYQFVNMSLPIKQIWQKSKAVPISELVAAE